MTTLDKHIFCPKCLGENPTSALFCGECGSRLGQSAIASDSDDSIQWRPSKDEPWTTELEDETSLLETSDPFDEGSSDALFPSDMALRTDTCYMGRDGKYAKPQTVETHTSEFDFDIAQTKKPNLGELQELLASDLPSGVTWSTGAPIDGYVATTRKKLSRGIAIGIASALVVIAISGAFFATGIGGNSDDVTNTHAVKTALEVKDNVSEYTWPQLEAISTEIADASSDKAGLAIAKKYNLVGPDGKLDGSQYKTIKLKADKKGKIKSFRAQIVGFRQDEKTDGTLAGISFLSKDPVRKKPMNENGTNDGGWENSYARNWLNGTFLKNLPDELQNSIDEVKKKTNQNGGDRARTGNYTAKPETTNDKVWLLSVSEAHGTDIEWYQDYYKERIYKGSKTKTPSNTNVNDLATLDNAFSNEGEQYKLYKDLNISGERRGSTNKDSDDPYEPQRKVFHVFNKNGGKVGWYLRSPAPNSTKGFMFFFAKDGTHPVDGNKKGGKRWYVPGFCI